MWRKPRYGLRCGSAEVVAFFVLTFNLSRATRQIEREADKTFVSGFKKPWPPMCEGSDFFSREIKAFSRRLPRVARALEAMNPYYRICVMVIRIVGGAFLLVGVLDLTAAWLTSSQKHTSMSIGYCLYQSILLVIGAVILIKSSAWARRMADYLDD